MTKAIQYLAELIGQDVPRDKLAVKVYVFKISIKFGNIYAYVIIYFNFQISGRFQYSKQRSSRIQCATCDVSYLPGGICSDVLHLLAQCMLPCCHIEEDERLILKF